MLQLSCNQKFTMSSSYSYTKQIQNTILASIPNQIKSKCSIRKIIRSISNLIKINPLECCLLAWLLSKSKYDIEKIMMDSRIGNNVKIVQDQYQMKVFMFLLMNGYYVKQFVGERIDNEIENQISKQIPNFKYLYTKKFNPEKSLKTLSLSDINKIFSQWTCRQNKRNKIDYNNLVDKILYLSKSYNVSAHDQVKQQKSLGQPKKRRKINHSNVDQNQNQNQNYEGNEYKSDLNGNNTINHEKSQSQHHNDQGQNKIKFGTFRFSHSPDPADFFRMSQQNQPTFKRQQGMDMVQSRRTTRNMLQSINIYDYIPSQDNLFNSQISSFSAHNLMGSQQSVRSMRSGRNQGYQMFNSSFMKKSKDKQIQKQKAVKEKNNDRGGMKLKQTQSFDQQLK